MNNNGQESVLIGEKHLMKYVNAIVMQLKNNDCIIVKSRGKFISKAVDSVEIVKRDFLEGIKTKVEIGSSEFKNKEQKTIRVSTLEITLNKK